MGEIIEKSICDLLRLREREIKLSLEKLKGKLENAPAGKLRISCSQNRVQYYYRENAFDLAGKFIKKRDIELAKALAQKDYDAVVLEDLKEELCCIQNLLRQYEKDAKNEYLESIHPERKNMIEPYLLNNQDYIALWEAVEYKGNKFSEEDESEYYTNKRERVRSKTEIYIANKLQQMKVPYRYEFPIKFKGEGMFYPDFYCLNVRTRKEIIWEHFGKMANEGYVNRTLRKINTYVKHEYFLGDNFIATFEAKDYAASTKVIDKLIEKYLL